MNIDENMMKNIKNMVDNGNISDAISQISPEMIQNFSKMLSNQNGTSSQDNSANTENMQSNVETQHTSAQKNSSQNENSNSANNFDFSNIDMDTIMKFSSIFGKIKNSKNDPRANLLNSLKPYLRDEKKGKIDQYMNLLNVSKIAEIMKDNNKENNNNV